MKKLKLCLIMFKKKEEKKLEFILVDIWMKLRNITETRFI